MATDTQEIKITEVQQSSSISNESHIVITQEYDGIETLFRAPYAQLFGKIAGKTPIVESLPEASADLRGRTVIYDDGMGDLLYVCVGNVDGSYEWLPIGDDAIPIVTPEDDGKIIRASGGRWVVSSSLTALENKIPWDVEDITSGAEFDSDTETFEIYGNGISYENGLVHIGSGIASVDNHIISF